MVWTWLATNILKPIGTLVEGWQHRKTARLENELALSKAQTEAKIERMRTSQEGAIAWEREALASAGWKDEYLLVVFSIPLVLCFIPGMVDYVILGFDALSMTPDWYQWSLGVMVSASFGYRKLADFMAFKKGV